MVAEDQWAWLEQTLASSKYDLFLINVTLVINLISNPDFSKITIWNKIYYKLLLCVLYINNTSFVGSIRFVVVVLFNVHGKQRRSCRDGQLT